MKEIRISEVIDEGLSSACLIGCISSGVVRVILNCDRITYSRSADSQPTRDERQNVVEGIAETSSNRAVILDFRARFSGQVYGIEEAVFGVGNTGDFIKGGTNFSEIGVISLQTNNDIFELIVDTGEDPIACAT